MPHLTGFPQGCLGVLTTPIWGQGMETEGATVELWSRKAYTATSASFPLLEASH